MELDSLGTGVVKGSNAVTQLLSYSLISSDTAYIPQDRELVDFCYRSDRKSGFPVSSALLGRTEALHLQDHISKSMS